MIVNYLLDPKSENKVFSFKSESILQYLYGVVIDQKASHFSLAGEWTREKKTRRGLAVGSLN